MSTVKSLEKEEIKTEVQKTFSRQIDVVKTLQKDSQSPSAHFLVPLSKEDLHLIDNQISLVGRNQGTIHLKQVQSQFFILLTNGKYYFKFPGDSSHQSALKDLVIGTSITWIKQTKSSVPNSFVLPIGMLQN